VEMGLDQIYDPSKVSHAVAAEIALLVEQERKGELDYEGI